MHTPRSKIIGSACAVLCITALVTACDGPPPETRSRSGTAQPLSGLTDLPPASYGESGIRNDWPPLKAGETAVSDNLLARNYYIVMDGSGSMASAECAGTRTKMAVAREAINTFVHQLPVHSHIGMFVFDSQGAYERLPLGRHNPETVKAATRNFSAGGPTPLALGIRAGIRALTRQARAQLGYGEYHLVVVTDGQASEGFAPDTYVKQILDSTPIVLHTIGFCIDANHTLNKPGYTIYRAASDPQSLMAGLNAVLAEAPEFSTTEFNGGLD